MRMSSIQERKDEGGRVYVRKWFKGAGMWSIDAHRNRVWQDVGRLGVGRLGGVQYYRTNVGSVVVHVDGSRWHNGRDYATGIPTSRCWVRGGKGWANVRQVP